MTTDTRHTALMEIGRNAYASIAEMVAALQLDWDRLEELRSDRDNWDTEDGEFQNWEAAHPISAEELAQLEATAGECKDYDSAIERIAEDPLSVQVRSDWRDVGGDAMDEPVEFCILLTTGGPAVRIVGGLWRGEPTCAGLQVQDWGTPWTDYLEADGDALLTYAKQFFYGE